LSVAKTEKYMAEASERFKQAVEESVKSINAEKGDEQAILALWEKHFFAWLAHLKQRKRETGINLLKNVPYSRFFM